MMRIGASTLLAAFFAAVLFFPSSEARAEVSFSLGFGHHYGYPHSYGHGHYYGKRHRFRHRYRRHYPGAYLHFYGFPYWGYRYERRYLREPAYTPAPIEPAAPPDFDTSDCREYTKQIIIDGEEHTAYGTACRQPDGTWKLLE